MTEAQASTRPRWVQRLTDVLAGLLGIGVILGGGELLLEDGPVGSGLAFILAGLALLPFIPIPGRGSRTVIFILGLGYGIGKPVWDSFTIHRETQQAVHSVMSAAARLRQTAVQGDAWHLDAPGALPDEIQVESDGWSRDIQVQECDGPACTLLVTLTDPRYHGDIRGRSFALYTADGGRSWHCRSAGEHSVMPSHLPSSCREQAGY